MLRINQLSGFGGRSEYFSVQTGETKTDDEDSTVGTSLLFNDVYLGPPYRNRYIALVFSARSNSLPVSVLVNGVTLTLEVSEARTATTPDLRGAIYAGRVSSGIFSTIEIVWSGFAIQACSFTLFRIASPFDIDFDTATGNNLTNISTSINVAAGGAILMGVCQNQSDTATLGGVTKILQQNSTDHTHVVGLSTDLSAQTGRGISVSGGATERSLVALSISPGS